MNLASSIPEMVRNAATRNPGATAVEDAHGRVTYAELVARATRLARDLTARGVGADDVVALHVPRGVHAMTGLLGILFSGAAFLPLDPAYPRERLAFMARDAAPRALVHAPGDTPDAFDAALPRVAVPTSGDHDADAPPDPDPASLAYVLYTSGSTGTPKGVCVTHESLLARVHEMRRVIPVTDRDRVLHHSSLNFDASFVEFFPALTAGATLHATPATARLLGAALHAHLDAHAITVALTPPSVLATLPRDPLPRLRVLMVGGEACPQHLVDHWARDRTFLNMYGPTEATVWVTNAVCTPGAPVTIGRPITGVTALVVDDALRPVPDGEVGELVLTGTGLARGYLNRPDADAQAFVHVTRPDGTRTRAYRTGDLARWTPAGMLAFHGRRDRQVKVRGVRAEPAEAEAALAKHPRVRHAVVAPGTDARGDPCLDAFLVLHGEDAGPAHPRRAPEPVRRALRGFLRDHLPEPMIPHAFVEIPQLPLTANGKVDHAALPAPAEVPEAASAPAGDGTPPRSETERVIADAWKGVLDVRDVSVHDNFFDVGGSSVLAADVHARLTRTLPGDVPLVALFEHPTIAGLAGHLDGADEKDVAAAGEDARGRAAARRRARTTRRGRRDAS